MAQVGWPYGPTECPSTSPPVFKLIPSDGMDSPGPVISLKRPEKPRRLRRAASPLCLAYANKPGPADRFAWSKEIRGASHRPRPARFPLFLYGSVVARSVVNSARQSRGFRTKSRTRAELGQASCADASRLNSSVDCRGQRRSGSGTWLP